MIHPKVVLLYDVHHGAYPFFFRATADGEMSFYTVIGKEYIPRKRRGMPRTERRYNMMPNWLSRQRRSSRRRR